MGLMSELVGVMLVIYIRFPAHPVHQSRNAVRKIIRAASQVPTFLILIGIIGIAAALVVEMLDISLITAIAMSMVLIFGIVFCISAWCLGMGGKGVM